MKNYIDDSIAGKSGPRGIDFNMRWVASLVAETHRILSRGGIFIYPADSRKGYEKGRLRMVYECAPIAFLIEQAGGAATDSFNRIQKFVALRKIVKKLIRDNEYKYCLSHMTTALLVVGGTTFGFKDLKSVLWYTHIGPSTIFKKIILRLGVTIADKIVTASDNSFPINIGKVITIGHAISYKDFFQIN